MVEDSKSDAIPEEYAAGLLRRGFHLERLLGKGAFGSVYLALQPSLGRHVAAKFFDNRYTQDARNRARFEREAQLLAKIEHRAVPYVLTSGIVDPEGVRPIPYTVMQFVRGETLFSLAKKHGGKLEWKLAVEIVSEILSALEAAHSVEVVHRDVKPDNVLHGPSGTYLIDFSIGICREYAPGLTRATRTGDKVGAIDYASPEQLRDASSVDARTDIYSAGVVLFELLSGHPRIGNMDSLDSRNVPGELRTIVSRATAHEPGGRFGTAAEFRDALVAMLAPGRNWELEPAVTLCPNTRCEGARWSESRQYFRGPRIVYDSIDRHCERCGTLLLRSCPGCRAPLPRNLAEMVTKFSKSGPDSTSAFCARCGSLLFRTPTCGTCGSLLTRRSMNVDTSIEGCTKCRPGRATTASSTSPTDEDIPF